VTLRSSEPELSPRTSPGFGSARLAERSVPQATIAVAVDLGESSEA
jgi:hypothetical protein